MKLSTAGVAHLRFERLRSGRASCYSVHSFMKLRWRFGIVAAIFLAIFCLYPQLKMFYLRGSEWNGHYAYNDIDEVAYASYVRALIDGRPRKNDPYSGRDDSPETPQPESLFSIQFAAPYSIALPARLFGIGTPWAMTLSGAIAGFLAALGAFWLIARITANNWYGMAGSLFVFAGGAVFAGEGALPEIFFDGFSYPYFPGFRRYIPAMAMAAVFALFALVWKLIAARAELGASENSPPYDTTPSSAFEDTPPKTGGEPVAERSEDGVVLVSSCAIEPVNHPPAEGVPLLSKQGGESVSLVFLILAATLCFAYTVFSYFYVWTTAAAWLGCLFVLILIFRPEGFRRDVRSLLLLSLGCMISLLPYGWLLSKRSGTMDHVQLLVFTRAPDLWRMPEYISLGCLVLIAIGVLTKSIAIRDRSTLFALSLSLVPLIVFNQQIVTGRSLQPIHYQVFIGNYVAGLALVLTVGLLIRQRLGCGHALSKFACAALALFAIGWGFVECHYTVRVLDDANVERDLALPVAKRLEELGKDEVDPHRSTVISYDMIQADDMPSVAPQNVLWARHQHIFAGLSWEENKERYFQMLYYSGIDEKGLDYLLRNDFVAKIALFGWGRHTDRLSSEARPLTYREIDEEVRKYAVYRANFDARTSKPILSFAVVNSDSNSDLDYLHRWYRIHPGEDHGRYTLHKLTLRSEPVEQAGDYPASEQ